MPSSVRALAALALLAACGRSSTGHFACGLSSVAGQSLLLEEFTRPGNTLSAPPAEISAVLPVRISLGPAFRSVTGRADSGLIIGVEGALPEKPAVGYGVLVVNAAGAAEGVLLYEGGPIQGAPRLGTVNAGARNLPLIGVQADVTKFEDAACPIFPDSLRR
ncbi:MAG TPA: hypothetical protein VGQ17_15340 [Gemmatimonadales bacterium]|jgi:hypothetical protein|nr:hypothetical protein [Gemmatimonadales bacterium]